MSLNFDEPQGDAAIIAKLDELINAIRAPKLPANKELWDAGQCAEYFKQTRTKFLRDTFLAKGFPEARNIGDTKNATNYRWVAGEVMAYAEAKRVRR